MRIVLLCLLAAANAFTSRPAFLLHKQPTTPRTLLLAADPPSLEFVPDQDATEPVAFCDTQNTAFIDCYIDSVAKVNGVEYTIGVPCDYSVALTYFDASENLVPVELDDAMMDDVFPVAESIVAEEFGEELTLQRTPQTLTLVGELEEENDEEEDDDDEEVDDDDDEEGEEVEILLSFEHRDKEFNLVRLLDPVLLVGKVLPDSPDKRILLTPDESDDVMPILEEMFLGAHSDENEQVPEH